MDKKVLVRILCGILGALMIAGAVAMVITGVRGCTPIA